MKQKKPTPSRPKLSFTVDRTEFDISSDWVQAVMRPPSLPAPKDPFFSPGINNATDASLATGEKSPPVVEIAPAENSAGVANSATVEHAGITHAASLENAATVAIDATVSLSATHQAELRVADHATVVHNSPRTWKLRPLRRITDGLTPGQYAVYSLMFANNDAEEGGERLYRGGYADLGRLTGLSKRGIQNVIGELQEKAVIRLHTAPGHHRLQTSAYVVPKPDSVLATWFARGWRFAIGKSKRLTDGTTVALLATHGAA
jgi:hypothetical protein